MSILRLALALLLASAPFVAVGCGSSSNQDSGGTTLTSPQNSASTITGYFKLGRFVSGGTAALLSLDGSLLAQTEITQGGSFAFPRLNLPPDFRVRATPSGSQQAFFTEVRGLAGDGRYVVVNLPTTLVSLYLQSHGGQSLQAAEALVRQHLGISPLTNLEYGISESVRSPFSHLAFFVDASRAGGLNAFATQTVGQLDNQSVLNFRAQRSDLTASLDGLESGLKNHILPLQSHRPLVLGITSRVTKGVLGFVGSHIVDTVLDQAEDVAWTNIAERFGLNYGTTVALEQIEAELSQVIAELSQIVLALSDQSYMDAANVLAPSIAYLQTLTKTNLGDAVQQAQSEGLPSDLPIAPAASTSPVGALLSQVQGFDTAVNVTLLENYQLGLGNIQNMNTLWRQNKVDAVLAVQADTRFKGLPFRSNLWLDTALQNYNFYEPWEEQAGKWLADNARIGNNLVTEINGILPSLEALSVSIKQQREQFPAYLPSDDVIVDLQNGIMWYNAVQGPFTFSTAVQTANNLTVTGQALGQSVVYDDWRLPTFNEVRALQARGQFYNGGYDPSVPSNSDTGYGDAGQAAAGLPGLGFEGVSAVFSDQTLGNQEIKDGGVWFQSYSYSKKDGWKTNSNGEILFNHANKDPNYLSDGYYRPLLMCRSIGGAVLSAEDPHKHEDTPPNGDPFSTNPVKTVEYPGLGVPTSLSIDATARYVLAELIYTIYLGGDFNTGNSSANATHSVKATSFSGIVSCNSAGGSPQYNEQILVPWFTSSNADFEVSNFPPAVDPDAADPVAALASALNSGTSSGFIFAHNFDDTQPYDVTANVYAYDSSKDKFVLTTSASSVQFSNQSSQITRLQISPRNRLYEPTGGSKVSETYSTAFFFDNHTVQSPDKISVFQGKVSLQLLQSDGVTAYTNTEVAQLAADGTLQIDLTKVPRLGLNLVISASIQLGDRTLSDQVRIKAVQAL